MQKMNLKKVGLGLIVMFIVFGLVGCGKKVVETGIENEQKSVKIQESAEINAESLTTYRNEKIGVEFEYPEKWGEISESVEEGCFYDPMKIVDKDQDGYQDRMTNLFTEDDKCENIGISVRNEEWESPILSVKSDLFRNYPNARGISWADFVVENKNKFCELKTHGFKDEKCKIFTTKSGVEVAKKIFDAGFSDNKEIMNVFYLRSPHPVYQIVLMSDDGFSRRNDSAGIQEFYKVVESLRFVE